MMAAPVHVETLAPPGRYTSEQLKQAKDIAQQLGRGKLVLVEAPKHRA